LQILNVTGSVIYTYFKMGRSGALKIYMCANFTALLFALGFLFFCPQTQLSTVTVDQTVVKSVYELTDLKVKCNANCNCDSSFEPVCGTNNISV